MQYFGDRGPTKWEPGAEEPRVKGQGSRNTNTQFRYVSLHKFVEAHTSVNAYLMATGVNQKKIKSSFEEYFTWIGHVLKTLTNEKNFPETTSQSKFGYGSFTNLARIILAHGFFSEYIQTQVRYPTSLYKVSS